jgi:predicted permease
VTPRRLAVALARAVHRVLLALVPRHVRQGYRAEMIATFGEAAEEASVRGVGAVLRLLLREIGDLARTRWAVRPRGPAEAPGLLPESATIGRYSGAWLAIAPWRQAGRALRRRPAYLATSVVTLGAGTGLLVAVFALVDTVLIKPLPYPDADRLVTLYESSPSARERTSLVAPVRLEDWQQRAATLLAASGSYGESVTDTSGVDPERLEVRRVSPRFFDVFAMPPLVGRTFVDDEERSGGPGAAVVSEGYWTRRFNRDPRAIGHALRIGDRAFTIVGVLPASFTAARTDAWLPAQFSPFLAAARDARFLGGIARLQPGVTIDQARRELASVQDALGREFPATDAGWSVELRSLKDARIGEAARGLFLVQAAVAVLWLIAICNLTGLTLVEVRRRAHELGLRAALGASGAQVRGTVIREGVLIVAAGGGVGCLLAAWLVPVMRAGLTATPRIQELAFDERSVLVGLATMLAAALVCTLLPALAARPRAASGSTATLSAGSPGRVASGGRHGLQRLLVVGQIALSVVLVGSAALLLGSYAALARADAGFDPAGSLTFRLAARWDEDRARVGRLQQDLLAGLRALPYVTSAGMTNFLPATGATLRFQVQVEGVAGTNADGTVTVGARMIGGDYPQTIGAHLTTGTWCPPLERVTDGTGAALINQRFVDVYAPGQTLLGRELRLAQGGGSFTVAGVLQNLAEDGPGTPAAPYVYTCVPAGAWPDPEYVVRTTAAAGFAGDLRRIARELDPSRAVFDVRVVQEVMDSALDRPRLDAGIVGLFAGSALVLAALGLYGLLMLVVAERRREMAVRLAVGATPAEVRRLVFVGAGWLVLIGVVTGSALSVAAARLLRGFLPGVGSMAPLPLVVSAVTLVLVAAVAVLGPALRASRTAPVEVLRGE